MSNRKKAQYGGTAIQHWVVTARKTKQNNVTHAALKAIQLTKYVQNCGQDSNAPNTTAAIKKLLNTLKI